MRLFRFLSSLVMVAFAIGAPFSLFAQGIPTLGPDDSKFEVFGGYSGYRIGGTADKVTVPDLTTGWAGQFVANVDRWAGLVAELNGQHNSSASAYDLAFGLRIRHPVWRLVPFGEGLAGTQHLSLKGLPGGNAATFIATAGMDVIVNKRFSVRPIELSYVNSYYATSSSLGSLNGVRIQAGIVYHLSFPFGPVFASCRTIPESADEGERVSLNVTPSGFSSKHSLRYSYETNGGTVATNLGNAAVDTAGLQPGTYTIVAKIVDDGRGKHQEVASCQAAFRIKERQPPTLARSTASEPEPKERSATAPPAVVESFQATRPVPSKQGSSNETAPAMYSTLALSSAPSKPAKKFGIIEFKRDLKRPTRVDNEAKGTLDRYADALAADPDAKGLIIGFAARHEARNTARRRRIAGLRAVHAKQYLREGKGIDPGRIEPRTGVGHGKKADLWIVEPGSSVPVRGSSAAGARRVKRVPLKPRAQPEPPKVRLAKQNSAPTQEHQAP